MSLKEEEFSGGESVYCINQKQLNRAFQLAREDPASAPRINGMIQRIESSLSRNERAALAFVLVDRLLRQRTP